MKNKFNTFKQSYLWYSFKRDKVAIFSMVIVLFLVLSAVFAPLIAPFNPYDPLNIDIMNSELPPFWMSGSDPSFILGTDDQGRDLLSTMIYGMRISLLIGVGAVVLQSIVGIAIGLISGYFGGKLDSFFMRMADVQLSFSYLMVAIFFTAILQAAVGVGRFGEIAVPFLILVIGFAQWPQYARTVRASVLAEKKKEYVEAARVAGFGAGRIMWGHIFPNTLSPILVLSTIQVANAVMSEAALSFLGLGMPISRPSLGSLINSGFEYIFSGSWWITAFPGILLVILILAINLLGDFLRDVLNPKLYKG
ncbi:binding-protein-dependent transport systems inner membrane component [Denitrovibrio acetiphilus DSM 12809]|uniref:Binding-protein-dependent transport systems inner membrane component n=1 Tax=Denitrovibrio acetiphilus (strain DSM 12809 / NBRC 114555 / N2460) TaxID=522772 RepID=D4H4D7_DENA2|nr:ABC transporter permease [Denitrovibrio acetiphilus]ADD69266.1 binding-protein-dependent transport systems inner membrane component [Denitrovibrio acetiphilus DSM 12809]